MKCCLPDITICMQFMQKKSHNTDELHTSTRKNTGNAIGILLSGLLDSTVKICCNFIIKFVNKC